MSTKRVKRKTNAFRSKQRQKNFLRKLRARKLALIEKQKENIV
tara:strand:+ start:793 stop:921 length:129 start_codon:yes stop_codon:yes gene_type:complete